MALSLRLRLLEGRSGNRWKSLKEDEGAGAWSQYPIHSLDVYCANESEEVNVGTNEDDALIGSERKSPTILSTSTHRWLTNCLLFAFYS